MLLDAIDSMHKDIVLRSEDTRKRRRDSFDQQQKAQAANFVIEDLFYAAWIA